MQDEAVARFIEQESFLNYCTGRNDEDVHYWQQWLKAHPEHQAAVETMRQGIVLMAAHARTKELEQNFSALQHRINAAKRTGIPVKRLWLRMTAAAAIVILLITAGHFLWRRQTAPPIATVTLSTFKNDITPGNKAILTLANGKQLAIAGLPPGHLTNTGIQKTANGTLVYPQSKAAPDVYNTLTVPNGGGKHTLQLADGTIAVLDAGSSIRFPVAFNGRERRVTITGQVYFEVVHNVKQPFYVNVLGQTIEDLGTHFNINAFDSVISTTLLEGTVKVGTVILKPGQQAVQQAGRALRIVNGVNEESVMAWKNGLFKFNNTDLKVVMQELGRWYDVQVSYEGPEKNYRFGGYLSREASLTTTLRILQLNGVKFSLTGKQLTVYR